MKVILGDNPFFAVNHRTGGNSQAAQSALMDGAVNVITAAVENSVQTLMISDHETAPALLRQFTKQKPDCCLGIALVVPYPHTINNQVSSQGYLGVVKEMAVGNLWGLTLNLLIAPFLGLRPLFRSIVRNYIRLQIPRYRIPGIEIQYVCLHNIVVDLLLAHKRADILQAFNRAVRDLGFQPVLITQNIPNLVKAIGDEDCTICGSYNLNGFMTNPSRNEVLQALSAKFDRTKFWAMQILASGAIIPQDALLDEDLKKFDAILYATSQSERVKEFSSLVGTNVD